MTSAPAVLAERQQTFSFGAAVWQEVERYDNCLAHEAINKSVQKVQGVDFVGLARSVASLSVLLLEVKDFRSKNVALSHRSVAKELAEKVLGTLAGITAAARANQAGFQWRTAAKRLADSSQRLLIVLHIESPAWGSTADAKQELAILSPLLERELAWLGECRVTACSERTPQIPDCNVTTVQT